MLCSTYLPALSASVGSGCAIAVKIGWQMYLRKPCCAFGIDADVRSMNGVTCRVSGWRMDKV